MSAAAELTMGGCEVADCARPSEGGGLCAMHRKRAQRGRTLSAPAQERLAPWGRVVEAALALADCDADDDRSYDLAIGRLRAVVMRWARKETGR